MIPCIGTVIVNRKDLLQRLIDSIDYPVGVFFVVNNSDLKVSLHDIVKNPMVQEYQEVVNKQQTGCAGGWNQILSFAFEDRNLEYVLICGNDIQWSPGDLQKIHEAYDPDAHFMSANWGFSTFALTRNGFDDIGWFDENYYPAYLEDGDYWRRCQLTHDFWCISVDTHAIHGDGRHTGSMTINSDPSLKRQVELGHERNWKYHIRKHGGIMRGGTEKYPHVFNDPSKPLTWWELSDERMKQPHFRTHG